MSALEIDGGDEIANGASNLYRVYLFHYILDL